MVQNAKNHTKSAITFEIIGFFEFSTTIDLRIKLPTQIIYHIEHLTNINFFKIPPKGGPHWPIFKNTKSVIKSLNYIKNGV